MRRVRTMLGGAALVALALGGEAPAQGIQTLCSGVGETERQEADAARFTLKVVVAQPDGHYLGDVGVRVARGGETLVSERCDGPWFLAMLPDGTYEIVVTHEGRTQSREVRVSAAGTREVTFLF